jgi:hypothetical protein
MNMFDSLPAWRPLAPRNRVQAASRSVSMLVCFLGCQSDALAVGTGLNTDGFLVDESSVCSAVLVGQIQRVTGEVEGMAAGFAFDEVGILVSCGSGQ